MGTPDNESTKTETADLDAFIARWQASGAAERANYQLFLSELCDALGVPRPEPSVPDDAANAYVFERAVTFHHADDTTSTGRIDLYKRSCFVLEAKQGADTTDAGAAPARRGHGVRGTAAWDDAMVRARGQAEQYLRALPADEPTPPFLVVVDVGHSVELFADFTRSGRTFLPFPDARSHRIPLATLTDDEVRERLKLVWTDPDALDPARRSARVTRDIAARLAELARELESDGHSADDVAHFLMRCLFTMFAEDVGLLPERSFTGLLEELEDEPAKLEPMLASLWHTMRMGGFSPVLRESIPRFNGGLFEDTGGLPVSGAQLRRLRDAARADWRDVEPAIFGTLLERALDPDERHRLGAHFTPRAYVERLVLPTVVEPLRDEWAGVFTAAATLARQGKAAEAQKEVRGFLDRLCEVKVLDPACGSGNFLYVTLEHLKRLEGEVVDALEGFGDTQGRLDLAGQTVDPHQLLGIELNPRAAAIAELVLWIGYLQWHLRNRTTAPPEPILRAFHTIECRDAVLSYDFPPQQRKDSDGNPVTQWDGRTFKKHPVTGEDVPDDTARIPVWDYPNARPAEWPEADFVVGNPPFVGASRMREALGDGYVEELRTQYPGIPSSCDYVMYWWDKAAELITGGVLTRFGLITTNSLTQTFNRRIVAKHLGEGNMSIAFAIPDHPWVDSADGADVRIAMTVVCGGDVAGNLQKVTGTRGNADDEKVVMSPARSGKLAEDLSVGADVAGAVSLEANSRLCSRGMQLFGSGFIVAPDQAEKLGLRIDPKVSAVIRPYLNGRDLASVSRDLLVIDLFGFTDQEVASRFPAVYQWVRDRVKPDRDQNRRRSYRENWWVFGEPRATFRPALTAISRYVATVETSRRRFFTFLDRAVVPDNKLVCVATDDASLLGVLSSRVHVKWALAAGSKLGIGNDPVYSKTTCFEKFPFPNSATSQLVAIRDLAEQLDAHRKRQQAAHTGLTLTNMYNVLEKLRTGEVLTAKEREVHEQGLVSVLAEIHDRLDEAVLEAYGWSDLALALVGKPGGTTPNPNIAPEQAEAEEELLARLVALNAERAEEEKRGLIRWLRPEYQAPDADTATQEDLDLDVETAAPAAKPAARQPWPAGLAAQANAVRDALADADGPQDPTRLAARFKGARKATVAEILDTLVALGHARALDDGRYAAG